MKNERTYIKVLRHKIFIHKFTNIRNNNIFIYQRVVDEFKERKCCIHENGQVIPFDDVSYERLLRFLKNMSDIFVNGSYIELLDKFTTINTFIFHEGKTYKIKCSMPVSLGINKRIIEAINEYKGRCCISYLGN